MMISKLYPNPLHHPLASERELRRKHTLEEEVIAKTHTWKTIKGLNQYLICERCGYEWHCQGFRPQIICMK